MGHNINALIGRRETLSGLIEQFGAPAPTAINFDLVIVPFNEQRFDMLAVSTEPPFEGFKYLTPKMADEIGRRLEPGAVLYIETAYHGSVGSQAAAFLDHGKLVWMRAESKPVSNAARPWFRRFLQPPVRLAKSPVSDGLARLGVTAFGDDDEFDRAGLQKFRSLHSLGFSDIDG